MNNAKLAVVLAIVGIVALGFGAYKYFMVEEVMYTLKCKESGEIVTMKLPVNTEFPCVNPKTKAKTLYKADRYYDKITKKDVYMLPEFEEIPPTMTPGGDPAAVKEEVKTPEKPQ